MSVHGKVILLISQESRRDRPQLALPGTTGTYIPKIAPVAAFKSDVRRFLSTGATDLDRARLDAAVTRFLGVA